MGHRSIQAAGGATDKTVSQSDFDALLGCTDLCKHTSVSSLESFHHCCLV